MLAALDLLYFFELFNLSNEFFQFLDSKMFTFIVAPCISMIQLFSHTNIRTCIIYY
jgi:hypothetical protein